jgi:hypothetical protein
LDYFASVVRKAYFNDYATHQKFIEFAKKYPNHIRGYIGIAIFEKA